jgi:hypothetical protein
MRNLPKKADLYAKTVEITPLPPRSAMELLMFHVENAARYAADCPREIQEAIQSILKRAA